MPKCPIPMNPVENSSQIAECGFCPDTNQLAVRFKSTPGKVYTYPITPDLHAEFQAADSKGSFLYRSIVNAKDEDGAKKYPHTMFDESADEPA